MTYLDYLPGFMQGITRVLISYPFDYFRIFKQININVDYIKEIKSLNFYKGIYFPLFSVPFDRALTFNFYEKLKKENYSTFECSFYPSIFSSLYMTPINLINTNYIYLKEQKLNTILKNNKTYLQKSKTLAPYAFYHTKFSSY